MVNFYHKFIPNLANIAGPLNFLHKKGVKFVWGPDQQRAFHLPKHAISHPPLLWMADFSREFILQTNASAVALGAVLLQEVDGVRQPIAYASHTLSMQERRASSAYEVDYSSVILLLAF
jgi:hypothetical protein